MVTSMRRPGRTHGDGPNAYAAQNLFESIYWAGARIGIGLSSASKPERTQAQARLTVLIMLRSATPAAPGRTIGARGYIAA